MTSRARGTNCGWVGSGPGTCHVSPPPGPTSRSKRGAAAPPPDPPLPRRTHAHAFAHVRKRVAGDLAGPLGAGGERALEPRRVAAKLVVALADGGEVGRDLVCDGALEVAVAGALE